MNATLVKIGCRPSPSESGETMIKDALCTFLLFHAVSEDFAQLGVAVLECIQCSSARMGYPNDEGLPEHPLYHAGIGDGMGVYRLSSSPWLADVEAQMRKSGERIWGGRGLAVKPSARKLFHFVLPLKEATFECLASGIEIRGFHGDFDSAFTYVRTRLDEH